MGQEETAVVEDGRVAAENNNGAQSKMSAAVGKKAGVMGSDNDCDALELWGRRKKWSPSQRKIHDQARVHLWLDLAKRNALEGDEKGMKNALDWAKKHGECAGYQEVSAAIAESIAEHFSEEKAEKFHQQRLRKRFSEVLVYMECCSPDIHFVDNVHYSLKCVKEFAESVNLENEEFQQNHDELLSRLSIIRRHRALSKSAWRDTERRMTSTGKHKTRNGKGSILKKNSSYEKV